jgi:SUN family beta-glucosidase
MKLPITLALGAATVASVAAAQPHGHQHRNVHKVQRDVTVTENVPGPTVIAYELNGSLISPDEACTGIEDGELKWADGVAPANACSSFSTTPTSTWTSISTSTSTSASSTASTSSSTWSSAAVSSSVTADQFFEAASSSSASWSAAPSSSGGWSGSGSSGSGLGSSFPDGQLDCSTFPSDYGAVAIDYLNMGGWIGLQQVTYSGNAISNIVTGVSGETCTEGMMCSYACPPGYQKTQWPTTQGSTGQSVGGLSCTGGKLHLTNSGLSTSLCMQGTGNVQATNNAGSVVAICRTDYPGTESETVPTEIEAGQTQPLTCPDASSYFMWEGQPTSAQYYLNPPGYDASNACKWGDPSQPLGNYAPINFGVGAKNGITWLSIMANTPTTTVSYPGTVEIQGNLSGSCKYENGQYCSDAGCNQNGCTVSLPPLPSLFCCYNESNANAFYRCLSSLALRPT